jgi:hypothetical protein
MGSNRRAPAQVYRFRAANGGSNVQWPNKVEARKSRLVCKGTLQRDDLPLDTAQPRGNALIAALDG